MKRIFYLYAVALAFMSCSPGSNNELNDFAGDWTGDLKIRDREQKIFVSIREEGIDTLNVYFYIPKANMHDFYMGQLIPRDSTYRIGIIHGDLNRKGVIRGNYTYYEKKIPIELRRTSDLPKKPEDAPSGSTREPIWTYETGGAIWSSPVSSDGMIYFGSSDNYLYALKQSNGQLTWRFDAGAEIKSQPILSDRSLYFLNKGGKLFKLDKTSGELQWSFNTMNNDVEISESPYDDYYSSPSLSGQMIFIGSVDNHVYAINEETGEEIWRSKTGGRVVSKPLVSDELVYVGSMDGKIYALSTTSGQVAWTSETHGPLVTSPRIHENTVIMGSRNSDLYAVNKETGENTWIYSYWTSWVESSGIIADDRLYIGSSDAGNVLCLNPANGEEYWTTFVGGSPWGNPTVEGTDLYIGVVGTVGYGIDHHGSFLCIDPQTGTEKWRFNFSPQENDFTYGVYATPLVIDDNVYAGALNGKLYAFAR